MDENQINKLAKDLKKKKIRKYVLMALAIAIAVYAVSLITIEAPDTKLPDGQGNIPVSQEMQGDPDAADDSYGLDNTEDPDETAESEDKLTAEEAAVDNSEDFTVSNKGNVALKPKEAQPVTVTLEIRCDTLSENMDYLETPSIADYIPEDGVILTKTEYKGTTDNTVFDALNTLCRNNDIHLEFSFTPIYESNYIEGIGYLYEFDGGPASGWMYKVNDWFPNYGCSSYYLSDGDEIVWCYTCRGYGADVGDDTMNGLTEVKEE